MYLNPQLFIAVILFAAFSCAGPDKTPETKYQKLVDQYSKVELSADLSHLSENEKMLLPYFYSAADIINEIFWIQAFGDEYELLEQISDENARTYAKINYGPYGRLEGHKSFLKGFDEKPKGANFYPVDMTEEEFNAFECEYKSHPYYIIRRTEDGGLVSIPYSVYFSDLYEELFVILHEAAELAEYQPMKDYLISLADSYAKDDFSGSEYKWMQMKNNNINLILQPFDTGEDRLFGNKAAHTSYILIKDIELSEQMSDLSGLSKKLQKRLPVDDEYKTEVPGEGSSVYVYNAVYYAGHSNAGPKIIALHLPQDYEVQRITGTKSIKIINVMEAKFDEILLPIADLIIAEEQRQYISADAFLNLTAFHEITGEMGISNIISGEHSVRVALREHYGVIDATVADLMALYSIAELGEIGKLTDSEVKEAYITSFASVMRSSRFGTAGAHGIAGMIRFNIFEEQNVFERCDDNKTYHVNFENMKSAVRSTLSKLLTIQGDGNYSAAGEIISEYGSMSVTLQKDIERINSKNIPVDVYFMQNSN